MRQFFSSSLTRAAVFVVLLSVLPALAIILGTGMDRYAASRERAQERGARYLRLVAERQQLLMETTETLFLVLSQLKEIQGDNARAGSLLLGSLLRKYPMYTDLFLATPEGKVLMSGALRLRPESSFQPGVLAGAGKGGSLAAVTTVDHVESGGPALHVVRPLYSPTGEFRGILGAVVSPGFYATMFTELDLPPGAVLRLMDGQGTTLAHYASHFLPSLPPGLRSGMLRNAKSAGTEDGHFSGKSTDGMQRFVAFEKLRLRQGEDPYLYAFFTLPEALIYKEPGQLLRRDLFLLAGALLFSLAAAWVLGRVGVVRPVRELLGVATRLGHGDLSARAAAGAGQGEIDLLAREFNIMAEALEQRDRELLAAGEAAEQSRRSKSEFLANMSHEIRTPMNAILGMAYLALKTEMLPQQKGYVTKLLAAANTLLRVINDILDFSKIEAGKFTMERISFSVPRLLGTVRGEAAAKAGGKGLKLNMRLAPDVPLQLVGDPLRLAQALGTLIDESVARSERGEVSVACDQVEKTGETITLRFTVKDAGVGLTPVQLQTLRNAFSSDGEAESMSLDGSVLGFVICNRLFRMMQGSVSVESEFGHGTQYMATAVFGTSQSVTEHHVDFFMGRRALVVDDNEALRHSLVDMLTGFGLEAEGRPARENIESALREAEETGRPFAFLFADWRPAAKETLLRFGRIRISPVLRRPPFVVLLTDQGRADTPEALGKYGISALLHRPVNGSVLFDTLGNLLADHAVQEAQEAGDPATRPQDLAGLRVLLVEDNIINQQVAEDILREAGMTLSVAGNGQAALDILQRQGGCASFDLVLMDLQMPEMDGFEATRNIREMQGCSAFRLPVIAMTAHSDSREVAACLAVGMNDHTSKPIAVDKLFAAIRCWAPLPRGRAEELAPLLDALTALARRVPLSYPEAEEGVEPLLPFIHEGRAQMLREALANAESASLRRMLEDLRVLAARPATPEPAGENGMPSLTPPRT